MDRRRPGMMAEPEPEDEGFGRMKTFAVIISALVFSGLCLVMVLATQGGDASQPPTPFPGSAYVLGGELDQRAPGSYFSSYRTGDSVPFGPGSLARVDRGLVNLNLPGDYRLAVYGVDAAPTLVELAQAGVIGQPSVNAIRLLTGSLVAYTGAEIERMIRLAVITDSGAVTMTGAVVGARFDPVTHIMEVDCLVGSCDLESPQAASIRLEAGQRTTMDAYGQFTPVGWVNLALYGDYPLESWIAAQDMTRLAGIVQTATLTPTPPIVPPAITPTPTPILPTWTPAPPTAIPTDGPLFPLDLLPTAGPTLTSPADPTRTPWPTPDMPRDPYGG